MVDGEKKRGGFTVSELEEKMRKFGVETALCAGFVLSAIFALIWRDGILIWSILLAAIGAAVGAIFPKTVLKMLTTVLRFCTKERVTSIVVAILFLLISIFMPILTFALVGLIGGGALSIACHNAFEHLEK